VPRSIEIQICARAGIRRQRARRPYDGDGFRLANAKEMITKLTMVYNKTRQAAITKELMDIVGGSEALK
jgi:hypothetical protein